ncbi:hypothetical protein ABER61_15920 [Brevibacillus formosus]|uniref:Uncharacterized protein n=1 Tax=Brevibacillus formosus TaxID=54913 RepID=A0A837KM68_9BACL|nr:hypothetical protein [Brevibacillus formosus]KLH98800.1 hypothetical protein AA984_09650 [Brevibacillus formosus]MED1958094.1 hypothetical protein [Brevibacillus formosus]PSJ93657.1 hypothetical protein C7R91_20580 [Brevibacillus formosus]GED59415.1 hypothetical protein BFO01nite_35470 [Brevibacillus formosus]
MNTPNDEQFFAALPRSKDAEPRSEFVEALEAKLVQRARTKTNRPKRIVLKLATWTVSAATVAAAVWMMGVTPEIFKQSRFESQAYLVPRSFSSTEIKESELSQAAIRTLEKLYEKYPPFREAEKRVYVAKAPREVYNIDFRTFSNKDRTEVSLYARAKLDAKSGLLLGFDLEKIPGQEKVEGAPSKERIERQAKAFMEPFLGKNLEQYRIERVDGQEGADTVSHEAVRLQRYVNDVQVEGDNYVIGMSDAGHIRYINSGDSTGMNLDIGRFPPIAELPSPKKAESGLAEVMQLTYQRVGKKDVDYVLRYRENFFGYLDARTGKEVKTTLWRGESFRDSIAVKPGGKKTMVTSEKEAAAAMEFFGQKVEGFTFTGSNVPDYMMGDNEREYQAKKSERFMQLTTVNNRAAAFKISYPELREGDPTLAVAELQERAILFLEPYLDSRVKTVRMQEQIYVMGRQVELNFVREVNGVMVPDQFYKITLDGQTGEIIGATLTFPHEQETFPDASKVISAEAAARVYLQHKSFSPRYVFPLENNRIQEKPVLVYSAEILKSNGDVDAITGEWLPYE